MNKRNTCATILGLALLFSTNALLSMDKPLHTSQSKVAIQNGTNNFDIAFKFADADSPANILVLPAGKMLILDYTPEKFSMKRSGLGDQYLSYTDYNLLDMVTTSLNKTPHNTRDLKSFGSIPVVLFESSYTNPLSWNVSVKWFTPPQ